MKTQLFDPPRAPTRRPCARVHVPWAAFLILITPGFAVEMRNHTSDAPAEQQSASEHPDPDAIGSKRDRDRVVFGEVVRLRTGLISCWALLTHNGKVEEVGVTVPLSVFVRHTETGDGPLGAIASLDYPRVVRDSTYFNHVEIHWNPHGHASPPTEPDRYAVPHFDLHFFSVPEAVVWSVPALPPPLPDVPAQRLPAGWTQPGPSEPEMGRHAIPTSIGDGPFVADMLAGFLPSGSTMIFIEPMITKEFLATAQDFTLPVPRPEAFGRVMLYPTKFEAEYDERLKAYHFVFSQFVLVE